MHKILKYAVVVYIVLFLRQNVNTVQENIVLKHYFKNQINVEPKQKCYFSFVPQPSDDQIQCQI